MAALELGHLSLADALGLTLLAAALERWPRLAARLLGPFIVESPAIAIDEVALGAAAVLRRYTGLPARLAGWPQRTLRLRASRHRHASVAVLLGSL